MEKQDTQETKFRFGKLLQDKHNFKLIAPLPNTEEILVHTTTYQKARCFHNPDFTLFMECVITVPLADVTRIGVEFKIQFESYTGTMNLNNFFNTNGDFTVIDVTEVVNQLFEIAYTYGKTSYSHFSKHPELI